jgi:hypothetical protein
MLCEQSEQASKGHRWLCSLCSFARNVISIGVSAVIQKGGGCILGCPPKFSIENHGREAGFAVPERGDLGLYSKFAMGVSSGDTIAQSGLLQSQPCSSRRASEQSNRAGRYGKWSGGGRGQVGPKSGFGRPTSSAADTGNTRTAKPFATKVCREAHRGVAGLVSRSRSGPYSQGRPEACHLAFVRSFAAGRGGGKGRRHRLLGRGHAEPATV